MDFDLPDIWNMVEHDLIHYQEISLKIKQILNFLEKKWFMLISQIKEKSFDDAQEEFNNLNEIQKMLFTIYYKYEFEVNDQLKNFIYYMDRDDVCSREYWYKNFCAGMNWPSD